MASINPSLPQIPGGVNLTPAGAKKAEGPGEIHRDLVIIAPPAEGEDSTILNVRTRISNKNLVPDPVTGEVPIEILVVRKDASLDGLPPAYIGDPMPEQAPAKGKVNVPAYISIDEELYKSGEYRNYPVSLLKPGEQVVAADALQKAKDGALPPGTVPEVRTSDAGIDIPVPKLGDIHLSYANIEKGAKVGSDFGTMIAGFNLALGGATKAATFSSIAAVPFGAITLINGFGQLKDASSSEEYIHTVAEARGATELPLKINAMSGKVEATDDTVPQTSVADLLADAKAGKRGGVGKLLQGTLVGAAGVTALTGAAIAGTSVAPFLALAGLAGGAGVTVINSKEKLDRLSQKETDLKAMLAEGKNTVNDEVQVFQWGENQRGQKVRVPVGTRKVDVTIVSKLEALAEEKKAVQKAMFQGVGMVASPGLALLGGLPLMAAGMTVGGLTFAASAFTEGAEAYRLHKKRAELQELVDAGQTTSKVWVPIIDNNAGSVAGSKEVELPLKRQIDLLDKKIDGTRLKAGGWAGGAAAMGGLATGAGFMASAAGGLVIPAGVYAYNQLSGVVDLHGEKKELKALQANGATTYKDYQVHGDAFGNVAGITEVELPIADRLKEIDKDMLIGGQRATGAITAGMALAAAAGGVPLLFVGAGLAVAALVHDQSRDVLKNAGKYVIDSVGKVAKWVGAQLSKLNPWAKDDESVSPATSQLKLLQRELAKVDKEGAQELLNLSTKLANTKTTDVEELKQIQAEYTTAFNKFKDSAPEGIAKWPAAVIALQREGAALMEQEKLEPTYKQYMAALTDNEKTGIDQLVKGPLQGVINAPGVQSMAKELGLSQDDVIEATKMLARFDIKGDPVEMRMLNLQSQAGDDKATKMMKITGALKQAVQDNTVAPAAQATVAPVDYKAAEARAQSMLASITPEEQQRIDSLLTGDEPLHRVLDGLSQHPAFVAEKVGGQELQQAAAMWVRAQVKQDPSQLDALEAKSQAGDPVSARQFSIVRAIAQSYTELVNQAQAAQPQVPAGGT